MLQKTFNFNQDNEYSSQDYIVSYCNLEAYRAIKNYDKWPLNRLLIIGEEGSGKTHLCSIWQSDTNAIVLNEEDIISQLSTNTFAFIFENIEKVKDQEILFHVINFCTNNNRKLLLTCNFLPHFSLIDLKSRLNATYKILIKNPEDDFLKVILLKNFSDKQLKVGSEVIDYILIRAERSFSFIKKFVEAVDKLSLEYKRNITVPLVREVLGNGTNF